MEKSVVEMEIYFPSDDMVNTRIGNMVIETGDAPDMPSPFLLFLTSIGACAGIYVKGFCKKRGLPLDGIRIIQRMTSRTANGPIEGIELDIQLPPEFPAKYYDAVIRAADQCAVKKHLENPPKFNVHTSVSQPNA
ncbi:OsmC family protein [Gemmatimonadota bacterium]